jgi:hypothetical protein
LQEEAGGVTPAGFFGLSTQRARMTKAIQGIVDAYVKLGNRRALEDLRMHRRKLAVDLKGKVGKYDLSLPLGQIDEEIAAIEAGLEALNGNPS